MKFLHIKEETLELTKALALAGILIVSFYLLVHNIPAFAGFLGRFFHALAPFIYGFCPKSSQNTELSSLCYREASH